MQAPRSAKGVQRGCAGAKGWRPQGADAKGRAAAAAERAVVRHRKAEGGGAGAGGAAKQHGRLEAAGQCGALACSVVAAE